ncbi:TetR/AcrR family transcriptional regulator [Paenibacillus sanfengchensis]|uniref:TetR/AcrR family transcriptional regulator n=1 Tax=Paenibacillus sanfengchensis TaxID=3119819 RepID=UPI002FE362E9
MKDESLTMAESWHRNLKNKHREAIIAAGKNLFMKKSFLHVNIKEVCELAGVSRVTFYKHFLSLDELIFEVQMDVLENMTDYLNGIGIEARDGKARLRLILEAWIDYARQHSDYLKYILLFDLYYEAYDSDHELKRRYEQFILTKKERHFLTETLEAGIRDGSLKPELPPLETGQFIFTAMMGLLQKISLVPATVTEEEKDDPIPQRFVDMILQYLADDPSQ